MTLRIIKASLVISLSTISLTSSCLAAQHDDLVASDLDKMLGSQISSAEKHTRNHIEEIRQEPKQPPQYKIPAQKSVSVNGATGGQDNQHTNTAQKKSDDKSARNNDRYEKLKSKLVNILKKMDDPEGVLTDKVGSGDLAISPNDIYLIRTVDDIIEQAEQAPLTELQVINDMYQINPNDRYKTYTLYINEQGTTLVEFLDAEGNPWPIYKTSPVSDYQVTQPENNTLWLNAKNRYKNNNLFVTLQQYKAPIQFKLEYSDKKHHGIASYSIPYLSPSNIKVSAPGQKDSKEEPGSTPNSSNDNHYSKPTNQSPVNDQPIMYASKVKQEVLNYLAATGTFESGSDAEKKARSVLVSDSNIAQIWFYNDVFLVRTPYLLLESYQNVINSAGASKVFVAKNLNSIVNFQSGNQTYELLIPDYHQYRSGW